MLCLNLMQRLSHLPTMPVVGPLRRRYLSPFPLCHKHHLDQTLTSDGVASTC